MELTSSGVTVTLTADVPTALLAQTAPHADDPAAVVLERLPDGVTLSVDGAQVPMTVIGTSRRMDLVGGTAEVLALTLHAAADVRGRHRVVVGNANLGDAPCWFRDEVALQPASEVHATNLVRTRRGRSEVLWGSWSRGEGLRRIDLDVTTPQGAWPTAFSQLTAGSWTLDEAAPRAWMDAWTGGRSDPQTVVAAAAVAFLLGGAAGGLALHRLRLLLVGGVAWGALSAVPGLPAGPMGMLAAVAALIVVVDPAQRQWAALLTVPWLVAAVDVPWTVATGACWLLGAVLGGWARPTPSRAALLLAAAAVVACMRG